MNNKNYAFVSNDPVLNASFSLHESFSQHSNKITDWSLEKGN